jgi:hypothetical protein
VGLGGVRAWVGLCPCGFELGRMGMVEGSKDWGRGDAQSVRCEGHGWGLVYQLGLMAGLVARPWWDQDGDVALAQGHARQAQHKAHLHFFLVANPK